MTNCNIINIRIELYIYRMLLIKSDGVRISLRDTVQRMFAMTDCIKKRQARSESTIVISLFLSRILLRVSAYDI